MAILLKDGSIFFHVPKTGGNWITDVLQKQGLVHKQFGHKHSDLNHMFHPTGDDALNLTLKGYHTFRHQIRIGHRWMRKGKPFMFCFVRHPMSWYESWFKYMNQDSKKWRKWGNEKGYYDWHPNSSLNGLGHSEFNQFMRNILKARPGYVTEMYSTYTTPMIDFIGRQENIREDLIQVLRQFSSVPTFSHQDVVS